MDARPSVAWLSSKRTGKTDRLNLFGSYAKGANTPQKLYEAIHKLGPLPLYHEVGTGSKIPSGELTTNKNDIKDKEPARDDAYAIYEYARRIAIALRNTNPDLVKLPPTETDPFLGLQTIQEWCIKPQMVKSENTLQDTTEPNDSKTESPAVSVKKPSKEAAQAYRLYYGSGNSQTEAAKIMTDQLHKPVSQGQVSKWVKQYKEWAKVNGIPIPEKPTIINMDSNKLTMGKRTDGRGTGDPRHKAKVDPDGDAYK